MWQKKSGIIIIILTLIATVSLFVFSKDSLNVFLTRPLLSISQLLALTGTILLCFSFILSSKFSFLENFFGGFDKVYKTHHIAGGLAFVFLLTHPMFLVADSLPNKKLAFLYILPSNILSYNFGIFALWLMIFLIILTIFIKLPYDLWKKTHQYMGLIILFASLHIFLISSDVSRFLPLRIFMLFFLAAALISYLYVRFLDKYLGPGFNYIVDDFTRKEDVIEILLKPIDKTLKFIPGQFAFLQFKSNAVSLETHPFSISSSPSSNRLRFSVKILGDYTLSLRDLKKGDRVKVLGPYGRFPKDFFSDRDVIGIAGGIGVTPFLGMLKSEAERKESRRTIFFFYCAKDKNELIYHHEVEEIAGFSSNIKYIPYCSIDKGRLKSENVINIVGDIRDKSVYLCGPALMMHDLRNQFLKLGVKDSDIVFEDFNFK